MSGRFRSIRIPQSKEASHQFRMGDTGTGKTSLTYQDLLDAERNGICCVVNDAKGGKTHYERQDDSERTVAVFGDTGVVTAKLRARGIEDGVKVDYSQWFTDVYVRTPKGWRYVYAQASLSLPSKSQD